MIKKLQSLIETYSILSKKMAEPNIISDVARYTKLAKENRQLTPTIDLAHQYIKTFGH